MVSVVFLALELKYLVELVPSFPCSIVRCRLLQVRLLSFGATTAVHEVRESLGRAEPGPRALNCISS